MNIPIKLLKHFKVWWSYAYPSAILLLVTMGLAAITTAAIYSPDLGQPDPEGMTSQNRPESLLERYEPQTFPRGRSADLN